MYRGMMHRATGNVRRAAVLAPMDHQQLRRCRCGAANRSRLVPAPFLRDMRGAPSTARQPDSSRAPRASRRASCAAPAAVAVCARRATALQRRREGAHQRRRLQPVPALLHRRRRDALADRLHGTRRPHAPLVDQVRCVRMVRHRRRLARLVWRSGQRPRVLRRRVERNRGRHREAVRLRWRAHATRHVGTTLPHPHRARRLAALVKDVLRVIVRRTTVLGPLNTTVAGTARLNDRHVVLCRFILVVVVQQPKTVQLVPRAVVVFEPGKRLVDRIGEGKLVEPLRLL
jgi:hypothetical protein